MFKLLEKMRKEKFREMEKIYNLWLYQHPKGDHNYKSFTHMRRTLEFAEFYANKIKNNEQ